MSEEMPICPKHGKMEHFNSRFGGFWKCTVEGCDVLQGASPFSTPADGATRTARNEAHKVLDPVWQRGKLKRKDCYRWLADRLGIPKSKCHIGMFDIATCEKVMCLVRENFPETE